jgi:hypothetical protein
MPACGVPGPTFPVAGPLAAGSWFCCPSAAEAIPPALNNAANRSVANVDLVFMAHLSINESSVRGIQIAPY